MYMFVPVHRAEVLRRRVRHRGEGEHGPRQINRLSIYRDYNKHFIFYTQSTTLHKCKT